MRRAAALLLLSLAGCAVPPAICEVRVDRGKAGRSQVTLWFADQEGSIAPLHVLYTTSELHGLRAVSESGEWRLFASEPPLGWEPRFEAPAGWASATSQWRLTVPDRFDDRWPSSRLRVEGMTKDHLLLLPSPKGTGPTLRELDAEAATRWLSGGD